jgi:hypothetical protein
MSLANLQLTFLVHEMALEEALPYVFRISAVNNHFVIVPYSCITTSWAGDGPDKAAAWPLTWHLADFGINIVYGTVASCQRLVKEDRRQIWR